MGSNNNKINKKNNKKNNTPLIIGGLVLLVFAIVFLPGLLNGSKSVVELENGNVQIDMTDLSSKGTYYSHNIDGTKTEFFAVKDIDGKIRLAFNRCQVCFSTGRGYFVQEDGEFVCQNCGNRYSINMIGNEKGGCNPSPIMDNDIIISDNKIEIKKYIFEENEYMFR